MNEQTTTAIPEALELNDLHLEDVSVAVEEDAYDLPEAGASASPRFSCSIIIDLS